jgi:hypothetical protein
VSGAGGNAAGRAGSSGTSGRAGSSGAAGQAGGAGRAGSGGGGAGGSDQGPDCPGSPPANASSCDEPRTLCQWGQTQCRCGENLEWACTATSCPATLPGDGTSCAGTGLVQCRYGTTLCTCMGMWTCDPCPPTPPADDTACPGTEVVCRYPPEVCFCTASGWAC